MIGTSQIVAVCLTQKSPCVSSVNTFLCIFNILEKRTCLFLVFMVTDPSFANKSAKDDILSL